MKVHQINVFFHALILCKVKLDFSLLPGVWLFILTRKINKITVLNDYYNNNLLISVLF